MSISLMPFVFTKLTAFGVIIKSKFSIKSITEELTNNPFGKYLIQKEDNEIIGYIYYSDIYERAEINQIEVKENKRNCGNGDKLLKKMIDIVQKDITLEVKENNVSAIKLYKNFKIITY